MPKKARSPLHARIGRRVRQIRTDRGMTQAQLAEHVGCSNHFVSGIERGVDSPSLMTLEAVAEALGTTVAVLVTPEADRSGSTFRYDLARILRDNDDPRLIKIMRDIAALYQEGKPKRRRSRRSR